METPTKDQLIQDLNKSFQEIINWINEQEETNFNKEIVAGKWTIAGHLYHLVKSTKAVSQGMKMPKLGLRTMFGKSNRQERTFDEMLEKYETTLANTVVKVPSSYQADQDRTFKRAELVSRFEQELDVLVKVLGKWKEADMSVYIMPHPAIGKCTIREFMYFTIFHTDHHLRTLKEKYVLNN